MGDAEGEAVRDVGEAVGAPVKFPEGGALRRTGLAARPMLSITNWPEACCSLRAVPVKGPGCRRCAHRCQCS